MLKIKRQRSSPFTLLLISRSYWFDKPRFVIEEKLLLATSTPSLGAPPNSSSVAISGLREVATNILLEERKNEVATNQAASKSSYSYVHLSVKSI